MTHAEFVEWAAYYSVEPFGEARGDIQTAQIVAVLANANRKPKTKAKAVTKFLPDWWGLKRSSEGLARKFRALTESLEDDGDTDGHVAAKGRD